MARADPGPTREILAAEAEFARREQLARDLASAGFFVIGQITSAPPSGVPDSPQAQPSDIALGSSGRRDESHVD